MRHILIHAVSMCILNASVACAIDFYGAAVQDIDVPSSYMRYGIVGFKSTVMAVSGNSPASTIGLMKGDILLSINNTNVTKSTDLNTFKTDSLSILVFRGRERLSFKINRLAIENEEAAKRAAIEKASKETAAKAVLFYSNDQPDKAAPALKFDDAALEKRYGRSTPDQIAKESQRANESSRQFEMERDRSGRQEQIKRHQADKLAQDNQRREAYEQCKRDFCDAPVGTGYGALIVAQQNNARCAKCNDILR